MIAETKMDLKFEDGQCEDAQEELAQLQRWVSQAAEGAAAFDGVERHIFRKMLEIGRHVMVRFWARTGPGDLGESVALEGCGMARRWPEQQARRLVSIFGEFMNPRCV